ncbi:MAG: hypothetical protein GY822_03435 [Deltaproteobacteria bacterium]|nr:hypothetical protein [Deltaproteobacteria bacterium]
MAALFALTGIGPVNPEADGTQNSHTPGMGETDEHQDNAHVTSEHHEDHEGGHDADSPKDE